MTSPRPFKPAQRVPSQAAAALFPRAFALHQQGRLSDAEAIYRQILAAEPAQFDCLHLLGVILHQRGDHAGAVEQIDRALQIDPDSAVALNNRGNALLELKRYEEALASYDRALALQPDYADALCNRGAALHELGRYREALASCEKCIAVQPGSAEAHANRGNTLRELRRWEDAVASCDRALALRPDFAQAHLNRANALRDMKRFGDALEGYDRVIALRPDYAEAFTNRGVSLQDLKRFDEALADYGRATAIQPDCAEAHYREAMCRLLIGDFLRGWQKQEWRWQCRQLRNDRREFTQPLWLGSDGIAGKTVLLHAEQGFGDTIQFARYAPLVAERGARVVLEVQEPLRTLLQNLPGIAQVVSRGESLPPFDLHCPLLSLPLATGAMPSVTPYLRPPADTVAAWSGRLGSETRPRIGIAWSGSAAHKDDHNRSIALAAFLSCFTGIGAAIVSLQPDVRDGDAAALREQTGVVHFGGALKNLADTAALIANLDLVVAVDTAVAHLAGALAKTTWVLLPFIPDWRWLLDRDDSPWYPAMQLFRQDESRRWDSVLPRVRAALNDYVSGHFDRLHRLGVISARSGKYAEAVEQIGAALKLNPDHFNALSNRGNAQLALGRYDDALASYDRALALQPGSVAVCLNRGNVLHGLKRYDEAVACFDRVLSLQPAHTEALVNRAVALLALERFEEALASCDRALALAAETPEALFNRGLALHRLKRFDDALASYDRALAVRTEYGQAHYNRANTLLALGRCEAALAGYDRAIALGMNHAEAHSNRAVALDKLMRFDTALESYDRAIALRPDFADAHYNAALCRLLIGDFRRGWEEHEWRWQTGQFKGNKRNFPQPLWLGSGEIAGKTILLHAEQGFGDTIQFCRYAPLVAERAAHVILEVQEPLSDLMQTLPQPPQVVVKGAPLPDFDLHCPLLSLPLAFGTELATIPSAAPYLTVPPNAVAHWGGRLPRKIRPRIGLVWSGRPAHLNDRSRSIPIGVFLSALAGIDATYVSLQREFRAGDLALLAERGGVTCFGEELKNFADTAALIETLDLVISVDTSVAHLAGALAKPVWILLPFNPDWRWLMDPDDSSWYPTARLFRQDRSRAWDSVMKRLHAELQSHVRGL